MKNVISSWPGFEAEHEILDAHAEQNSLDIQALAIKIITIYRACVKA